MDTPNDKIIEIKAAQQASLVCASLLEETLRAGAQRLLAEAIEAEVEDYVARHAQERDQGFQLWVDRVLTNEDLQEIAGQSRDRGQGRLR